MYAQGRDRYDEPPDSVGLLITAVILLGLAVLVVALVPAICGVALFYGLRRLLARRDWAILALAGVAGFAIYAEDNALVYARWLLSFVNVGPGRPGGVPVMVLLCLSAVLAGCVGAVFGERRGSVVAGLATVLRTKKKFYDVFNGAWFRRKELVDEPITPRPGRREMLKRRVATRITVADIPAVRGPYSSPKAKATPLKDKALPIGLGAGDRPVWLSTRELGMHGAVVGSTGSGKTVTLMWIIGAALDMGFDVTVLDMKEDTEPGGLRDFLRAYAQTHHLPLQEMALGDERPAFWYNALAGMSADEAFDTIMTMVEFDDAYWQALNRKVLRQVVQLCYEAARAAPAGFGPPSMLEIGKIMEQGEAMKDAVKDRVIAIDRVRGTGYCRRSYANVLRPSRDEAVSASGFGTRLTALYDSGAGRRILVPGGNRQMIDVRREGLTYIGLNSLGQPDMARILSSSALQRLSVYAAQRIQGRAPKDRPRLIVVDEANFIDRGIAMNMLSRVRSALFSMILCTQGPTDWIDKDGDDWSRLIQNINWLFAMAQSSPEAAEKCAEFLGIRRNSKYSERLDQDGTPQQVQGIEEEQYIVEPRELRDLGTGEGYLRVNKPDTRVEYAVVPMRTQELDRYEPPDPYLPSAPVPARPSPRFPGPA
ncbi:type IV secretory system conjugative DNA transfer family protein [Actinomadura chokoriensis]|uniref:type IV secretory system conjugative DNA transfer family protein n=1 Tax=Actinomadura chokoriensis TaxID=454156 RepID=UPI0031F771D1